MARVKRGSTARERHKKVLKITKGFRGSLSKLYRPAHQVMLHALSYMYRDRKNRKRDFRGLWINRINAALEMHNISYARFMGLCKAKNVLLNRKVMSELAIGNEQAFAQLVAFVKG